MGSGKGRNYVFCSTFLARRNISCAVAAISKQALHRVLVKDERTNLPTAATQKGEAEPLEGKVTHGAATAPLLRPKARTTNRIELLSEEVTSARSRPGGEEAAFTDGPSSTHAESRAIHLTAAQPPRQNDGRQQPR